MNVRKLLETDDFLLHANRFRDAVWRNLPTVSRLGVIQKQEEIGPASDYFTGN
jgi:hypothetical protein